MLTVETPAGLLLLPGATGFTSLHWVTINPSYYIFPALQQLSDEVPDPAWTRLWNSGRTLLRVARFGRWELPPDWLMLPLTLDRPQPASGWPARFSFDAVRVPLYLAWAGLGDDPVVSAIVQFWNEHPDGSVPAWVDLAADGVAHYAQPTGMVAVRRYVEAMRSGQGATLPTVASAPDYYAAALTLLARVALEPPLPAT